MWLENNLSQAQDFALNNHKPPFLLYAVKMIMGCWQPKIAIVCEDNLRLYVGDTVAKNMAIELRRNDQKAQKIC